jgi:hypothetical protein
MNKKFLLLVMCTLAFSVYAADDSYVVVPRQAGVIYKNEDDQEIGYTVRDERGTELSAWFFKKDYTYASKTSKNGSTMCLQGTTLYVHPSEQLFNDLSKLWLEQEKSQEVNEWEIVKKEQL